MTKHSVNQTDKTKKCLLCRKEIYLEKDDYVRVTDYYAGSFFSEGFYHLKCYVERLNKTSELQKKAEILLSKAASLMGVKEQKEFVIKNEL